MINLPGIEVCIAIGEEALNTGLLAAFGNSKAKTALKLDDDDWKLRARLAAPQVSFVEHDYSHVRVNVPFEEGTLTILGENKSKQYDIAGASVHFLVPLQRIQRDAFHDVHLTVEELYLDLTDIAHLEEDSLQVEAAEIKHAKKIVRGVVDLLVGLTEKGKGQLFLGRIKIPQRTDAVGPFAATGAAIAAHPPEGESSGQLTFLMTTEGKPLPDWARGIDDKTAFTPPLVPAADASHPIRVAVSGAKLLQAYVMPALEKSFPGIKLTLVEGPPPMLTKLPQPYAVSSHRGMTLTTVVAKVGNEGIDLSLQLLTREKLQTGDDTADVDFSILTVVIEKKLSFTLKPEIDELGLLNMRCIPGPGNTKEPTHRIETNFEVHKFGDLLKWAAAPAAVLAAPFIGPLLGAVITTAEAIAMGIQSGIVDVNELNDVTKGNMTPIESMESSLQLPGDPILDFSGLSFDNGYMVLSAKYLDYPPVRRGSIKPFALDKPVPRVSDEGPGIPETTEPQLVGETLLRYRYVKDPRYKGEGRRSMPYYTLSREQFWWRRFDQSFPAHTEIKNRREKIQRLQSTENTTMTDTLGMELTVKGEISVIDAFAPEISAEVSRNLEVETSTEIQKEWTDTIELEITSEAREEPFGLAIWFLADRYTLRRTDAERSIVNQWTLLHENYKRTDDYKVSEGTGPA